VQELALTSLSLEATPIVDLTAIAKIKTLRTLNISNTAVSNGAPLADLKELRSLEISTTSIADLSFLDQLGALQDISMYGISPVSYEPLFKKTTITRVSASFAVLKELRKHWTHKVSYAARAR
jgi:internalin A